MDEKRIRETKHRDGLQESNVPNSSGITTPRLTDVSRLYDDYADSKDLVIETDFRLIALNQPSKPKTRPTPPEIIPQPEGEISLLFSYCGWTNFLINGIKPKVNDNVSTDYDVTQYDSGPLPITSSYATELRKFAAPIYSALPNNNGNTYWTDKTYIPPSGGNTLNIKALIETLPDNFHQSTVSVLRYQYYDGLYVTHPLNSSIIGYDYRPLTGAANTLSDMLTYSFDVWIRIPDGITSVIITGGLKGHTIGTFSANYRITTIEPEIDASADYLISNAMYGYQRPTTEYIKSTNFGPVAQALVAKGIVEDNFYKGDRYFGDFDPDTGNITDAKNVRNDLSYMLPFEYNFRYPTKQDYNNDPNNPYYIFSCQSRLPVRAAIREDFKHTAISSMPYHPVYFYPDHPDYFPGSAYSRPTSYKEYSNWTDAFSKPISNAGTRNDNFACWLQTTSILKSGTYGYSNFNFSGVFEDYSFNTNYGRWEHLNDRNNIFTSLYNNIEMKPDTSGYIPHRELLTDRFRSSVMSTNVLLPTGAPQPVTANSWVRVKFWASINHLLIDEFRDDTFSLTFNNGGDKFEEFYDSFRTFDSFNYSRTKPPLSTMPNRPAYQNASWMTSNVDQNWDGTNATIALRRRSKLFDCYLGPLNIIDPISFEINMEFA